MLQDRELAKKVKQNGSQSLQCSEGQNGLNSVVVLEGEESVRSAEEEGRKPGRILPALHNSPVAATGTSSVGPIVGTVGSVLPSIDPVPQDIGPVHG